MNLSSILQPEAVIPHLPARDKKQALKLMASPAAKITGLPEREIFSVLLEREHIGCTGMGNGVCIPHGRFEGLKRPYALFARLDKPIEFGAADGRPVDLIFLLLTPTKANTDHLKALATVSRLLRDKELCRNLRGTNDASKLHDMLVAENEEV